MQCREGPIGGWNQHLLEPGRFLDVAVPARVVRRLVGPSIPVDLHEPDPGLDQTASQQDALPERACAISSPVRLRLVFQAKGLPRPGRSEKLERPPRLLVVGGGRRSRGRGLELAPKPVKEVLPPAHAHEIKVGGQGDLLDRYPSGPSPALSSQGSAERPRKPASWPGQTLPSVLKIRWGSVTDGGNPLWLLPSRPSTAPRLGASFGGPGLAFSKFIGWCGRPVSM